MRYGFGWFVCFGFVWLTLGPVAAAPLPPAPDSLRAALQAAPAGAARVRALLRVALAFSEGGDMPDSAGALGYCQAAVALSRQLGDSVLVGLAYENRAAYYLEQAHIGTAAAWLRRATPLLRTAPPAVRANLEYHLAWLSEEQVQPRLARQHYRQSIGLYRQARLPAREANTTMFISRMLQKEGEMDSAAVYIFRALALYQQVHDTLHIATVFTNVASLLADRKERQESNRYLKQAYQLAHKIGSAKLMLGALNGLAMNAEAVDSLALEHRYIGMQLALNRREGLPLSAPQLMYVGDEFKRQQLPDSAISYYLKAIRRAEQKQASFGPRGSQITTLATYYEQLGQPVQAAFWAKQALALRTPLPEDEYVVLALSLLGRQAQQRHDYRTAYELLQQESTIRAAWVAQRHTNLAEKVRARYEVDQAEQRVRLLQQDQELARLRRQQEWAGGLGLFALTLGAGGWGLTRYRRRQRGREDALRTRLAADLHDDVGSLLTQISLESSWLKAGTRSPAQLTQHLDHLAEASRRAVQQLSDVVWGIDARNDATGPLLERLRDHAHETLSVAGLDIDFAADPALADLALPLLVRQNLYLIYKEALHNAVKHAQATQVTVRLWPEANALLLLVQDNGRGYTGTGRPGGQGRRNMEARAAACGGSLAFEAAGPGFGVRLRLPV
jgi:signal transduction histidine kinase